MYKTPRAVLIAAATILLAFGITMLYSTSYAQHGENLLRRQLIWIGGGGAAAVLLAWRFDYRTIGRYSWWMMGLCAVPLAYLALANVLHDKESILGEFAAGMPLVAGLHVGSARWLRFGPFTVQPSEFAKLAIILFLANYFPRHARHTNAFRRGFLTPMSAVAVVTFLILGGGDLSTTAIAGCVAFGVLFIAGVRLRFLALACAAGLVVAATAVAIKPQRISRVTSYRNPEQVQTGSGYQLWHSQLALGSGSWRGRGFTNSRMKRHYLPEAHTDFIVAIIGEELGFVGIALLIVLYIALLAAGFWIACVAADYEGTLLACGITMALGLQTLINVSVVSGFSPTTGVTAPLLSYGGSSLVTTLVALGLLLNILRIAEQHQPVKPDATAPPTSLRLRARC